MATGGCYISLTLWHFFLMHKSNFTFIDLFAGIGGFHIAMHRLGGECVFASEIDKFARITYQHNFEKISPQLFKNNFFNEDITSIDVNTIPDADILCAGFPCQSFSTAGLQKGFNDTHESGRGAMFFKLAEIIKAKRPKAFFLENVQGLLSSDKGKTFATIRKVLEVDLGYSFYFKLVRACDYGLPQFRARVFMIGFRENDPVRGFTYPPPIPLRFNMSDVFGGYCDREIGFTVATSNNDRKIVNNKIYCGKKYIRATYNVDGILTRITHKEARFLQGFPLWYEFPVSKTQAYKQIGNSVAIDAVEAVGACMVKYMHLLDSLKNK